MIPRRLLPSGMFYGVTSNPTILQRDGVSCTVPAVAQLAREGLQRGASQVMLQARGRRGTSPTGVGAGSSTLAETPGI